MSTIFKKKYQPLSKENIQAGKNLIRNFYMSLINESNFLLTDFKEKNILFFHRNPPGSFCNILVSDNRMEDIVIEELEKIGPIIDICLKDESYIQIKVLKHDKLISFSLGPIDIPVFEVG